jgi:phosphoribosylaminoimidazolecarboxamide formyltransferase/IMP cyclohydrolase
MNHADSSPIRRALISVSDKTGLLPLANFLNEHRVEFISTGGTAAFLRQHGFNVTDVSTITSFPEIMDGRVKTLHPKIHAALLAKRSEPSHIDALTKHHIAPIDLVVVNLYPFEQVASRPDVNLNVLIENIDIGGPSMLRSAAKNHDHVCVLCDPKDYAAFEEHFGSQGGTTQAFRQTQALKVFAKTAAYDDAISRSLSQRLGATPTLRYGENPHQNATVQINQRDEIQLAGTEPLQGKALSYNNLIDADSAIFALRCLVDAQDSPTAGTVIIKHCTPCGAAIAPTLGEAFTKALASDPVSAFGGIVALSHHVDASCAGALASLFLEVIVAPGFSDEARDLLSRKKDLRLLAIPNLTSGALPEDSLRSINGGVLRQDHDKPYGAIKNARVVTTRAPSQQEWRDLDLAFRLSIPCKSNAITLAKHGQLLGAGAGQTSRLDSVNLAISKALTLGHTVEGSALGSDAFFPFADGIEAAAKAGIKAIAQPGGSKRDDEVIAAANTHGITMVFTGQRHFKH